MHERLGDRGTEECFAAARCPEEYEGRTREPPWVLNEMGQVVEQVAFDVNIGFPAIEDFREVLI